jgi:alpha-N-acetylglucosaminidase
MKALKLTLSVIAAAMFISCGSPKSDLVKASEDVIVRAIGSLDGITLQEIPSEGGKDCYEICAQDGLLVVKGSSPSAICYAFNKYLRYVCGSMITWGGKHLELPDTWPDWQEKATSPYQFRYFLNVCTFGYTTPYWGWDRWSEELDWMALHGVNMPLASVASEAIARRVWVKLGLSEEEADAFFTGPAHLPWHRMGNLNAFDGPLSSTWHEGQIALQHKILDKMRALGMEPVAPAFAGFVPPAFMAKHPEIKANQLLWGGFDVAYNACVLAPDSPYFQEIGKLFIQEWEKEFGDAKYYLSDSFNEMKLPVDKDDVAGKHSLLAQYGEAIYKSIAAGNPDAVWVTQGWTFGYQHDFWDKESMKALLSRVPDDKLIIVDLGNDYPKWVWHTEQTWKVQEGFYGKQWIYSYVPNFGGKVLPTGDLTMYATGSVEALNSPYSENLVGFGSAPEGLENNEVVYELLADMGWAAENIDLEQWLKQYCLSRYGYWDEVMQQAWNLLHQSVYSSLYSYPRFTWQTVVPDQRRKSLHDINDDFGKATELFLSYVDQCSGSQLYMNDAVEFAALYIAELADRHYENALQNPKEAQEEVAKTVELLQVVDKLLATHPDYSLRLCVDYARAQGQDENQKNLYEANAKRLITTWGGWQEDYAARFWAGLVGDYYIPRIQKYFSEEAAEIDQWEENWIRTPWNSTVSPYENPIEVAMETIRNNK